MNLCRYDGLRRHDMHTKFRRNYSGIQKLTRGDTQTEGHVILFSHNKENRLKANLVRAMYKSLCSNYVLERNTLNCTLYEILY
jgi:hypothetical protein